MTNRFPRIKDLMRHVSNGVHADAIRRFNADARMSVFVLAAELGLDVEQRELRNRTSGYLVRDEWSESGFKIIVNLKDSRRRRRFTILHEIGHFLLHASKRDLLADAKLRSTQDHFYDADEIKEEREANAAASALLFADGSLRNAMIAFDRDLEKVARYFGVTVYVVRKGIKDFGV